MARARMGEALEIRPAKPSDARAFLEFWTAIVAEERFVRSEEVGAPARAFRRRFRQRSGLEIHLIALEGGRLVGHVNVQRERHPVTHHVAEPDRGSAELSVRAPGQADGAVGSRCLDRDAAPERDPVLDRLGVGLRLGVIPDGVRGDVPVQREQGLDGGGEVGVRGVEDEASGRLITLEGYTHNEQPLVLTEFGVTPPEYLGVGVASKLLVEVQFSASAAAMYGASSSR